MNRGEVLNLVASLHREWQVDREIIFTALEEAFSRALRERSGPFPNLTVRIDRGSGDLRTENGGLLDLSRLGRGVVFRAKQDFLQRLKEARAGALAREWMEKRGTVVFGRVRRREGRGIVLDVGKGAEAVLPEAEQIPGEALLPGTTVKAFVKRVEARGSDLRIVLSRASEEFVLRLFELEVPEIQNGTCVVERIVRDPGFRTKMLVRSTRPGVDGVGACVGRNGTRIQNVVDELNGEKIDVIPWSEDEVERVRLAMKPAEIAGMKVDRDRRHVTMYVARGALSQAIGRGGRNVRLASRLTGWEIDLFELEPTAGRRRAGSEG